MSGPSLCPLFFFLVISRDSLHMREVTLCYELQIFRSVYNLFFLILFVICVCVCVYFSACLVRDLNLFFNLGMFKLHFKQMQSCKNSTKHS